MKLAIILTLLIASITIQTTLALPGSPLLHTLILPAPILLLTIGMLLWGFRPERQQEKYRKRKKQHVQESKQWPH